MDRGALTVQGAAESRTQPKRLGERASEAILGGL